MPWRPSTPITQVKGAGRLLEPHTFAQPATQRVVNAASMSGLSGSLSALNAPRWGLHNTVLTVLSAKHADMISDEP
jgi:hypothetical protein